MNPTVFDALMQALDLPMNRRRCLRHSAGLLLWSAALAAGL